MAFTSCQGQPLSAERSGASVFFGITVVRDVVIWFNGKKSFQTEHIRNRALRCNRFATENKADLSRFYEGFLSSSRGPASLPASFGMLPTGHGNSAEPSIW